ncbi:MAG: lipocalin family protein [Prevotella sp.]|nr:lipocalin family protein [Prevotella sp.]
MRKLCFVMLLFMAMIFSTTGCRQTKTVDESAADSDTIVMIDSVQEVDSTVYGVCGEGSAMHTLELITDGGDTLYYTMRVEEDCAIVGGLMAGDRMAVMGKEEDHGLVGTKIINLTTLLGKWTSLDKNFEILEGGLVNSSVEAESNPWVSWKILNGKLLLNTDTFDIVDLGADSLYIENQKGIFVYKRAI